MRKFITDILAKTNLGVEQNAYVLGTVGIGTTSPSSTYGKLTVAGGISTTDDTSSKLQLGRYSAGIPYSYIKMGTNSNGLRITNPADNEDLFTITSGGNVGIGTTSPSEKLHVVGKGIFESNVRIYPVNESWAEGLSFIMPTTANWGGLRWQRQRGNNDGNWYIGFTALDSTDDLVFGANNGGSQVNNIIRLTKAGNVGIGTATPYQLFTVNKSNSAGAGGYIRLENTVGGVGANVGIDFATYSPEYYGVSGPTAQIKATDITNYAGRLDINVKETGSSGALQTLASFNYTGNVGIGTTSPAYKLDVNGTGRFTDNVAINGTLIGTDQTFGGPYRTFAFGTNSNGFNRIFAANDTSDGLYLNSATGRGIYFRVNGGGANVVSIDSTGAATFSSSVTAARLILNNGDNLTWGGGYGAGIPTIAGYNAGSGGSLYFYPNGSTSGSTLTIDSTGAATFSSSVNATTVAAGSGTNQAYLGAGFLGFYNAASSPKYIQLTDDASTINAIAFSKSGSSSTTSFPSGNVGIGTTTPASKLHVEGNISAGFDYNGGFYANANSSTVDVNWGFDFSKSPSIADYSTRVKFYSSTGSSIKLGFWDSRTSSYVGYFDGGVSVPNFIIPSGNVGIGTTNPQYKLHVAGNGAFTGVAVTNPDTSGTFNRSSIDVSSNQITLGFTAWGQGSVRAGTAWVQTVNNWPLILGVNDSEVMRLATSGNVGIGTSSPGYKLEVVGSIWAIDYFIQNSVGTGGTFRLDAYQDYLYIYGDSSAIAGYRFGSDIVGTVMQIGTNGNVGIGTTSPAQKLDVIGTIRSQVTSPGAGNGDVYAFAVHEYNGNNGRMGLGLHDTGDAFLGLYSDTGVTTRIDSNGSSYFMGGSVGIGTSSPTGSLDIYGTTGFKVRIGYFTDQGADDPTLRMFDGKGTRPSYSFTSDNTSGIFGGSGFVAFSTSASEKMRITSGGNVGIGTTSPASKLEVRGAVTFFGDSSFQAGNLVLVDVASGGSTWGIYSGYPSLGDFTIRETGIDNRFVIKKTSGNVGIGTASPSYKLDVYGGTDILKLQSTGTDARINIGHSANGGYIGYTNLGTTSNLFYVTTGSGTIGSGFVMDNAGNVGIGTTSPSYKLDLATGNDNAIRILNSLGSNNNGFALAVGSGTPWLDFYGGRFDIKYNTSPGSWNSGSDIFLSILSSGNVGIGTTNPAAKFQVTDASSSITLQNYLNGAAIFLDGVNGDFIGGDYFHILADGSSYLGVGGYAGGATPLNVSNNGNVGIGTTTPGYKLEVIGNIYTPNSIYLGSSGVYSKLGFYRYEGSAVGAMGWHTDDKFYIGGFPGWGSTAGNEVRVYGFGANLYLGSTLAGDVVAVTTSGNVGIGTTSPSYKLNVVATSATDADIFQAGMTGVSNGFSVQRVSSAFKYTFVDGNVGIGTTAPKQRLIVEGIFATKPSGVDGYYSYLRSNWNENDAFELGISENGSSNFHKLITSSNYYFGSTLQFWTADVERIRIISNGNVGIGTTSPVTGLDVRTSTYSNTTARFGTSRPVYIINDDPIIGFNQYYNSGWKSGTTGYSGNIGVSSSGEMYFNVSTASVATDNTVTQREVIRILNNGNVGIGTNSPGGRLDVVPSAQNGINIARAGGYPSLYSSNDFVFETDSIFYFGVYTPRLFSVNGSFYVTASGNVGIGTSSPTAKLDVQGNPGLVTINTNGALSAGGQIISGAGEFASSSSGTDLNFRAGSTHLMVLKTSGNVGIGTTTPTAKLQTVSSGLGDGGGIRITNSGAGGDDYRIWPTATVNGEGAGKLIFTNNGGNVLTLTSAGNVGIGTISPAFTLDVNGNAAVGTKLSVGTAYNGFALNVAGTAYIIGGSVWTQNGYGFTNSGSTNTGMFPDSNHIITFKNNNSANVTINASGNVGIGTTSPTEKLHVSGNIVLGSTANGYQEAGSKYIGLSYPSLGTDGYVGFQFESVNAPAPYNGNYSQNIKFYTHHYAAATGGTPRMTIQYDGNVGIGTTSPVFKLDVNGNTRIGGISSSNTARLNVGGVANEWVADFQASSTTNQSYGLVVRAGTSSTDFPFYVLNSSSANAFFAIKGDGNVGIGTTSPNALLHVAGTIHSFPSTTDGILQASQAGSSGGLTTVVIRSNGVSYFNGGNVGIGTSSPSYKLDVTGLSGDWATRFASNANASAYFAHGGGYGAYIDAGSNATSATYLMSLVSNGSTRVYVRGDGVVGIGTGSPSLESAGLGLDIFGDSYTQLRVRSGSTSAGIEFKPGSGKRWEIQANTSSKWFVYDRTDQLYRLLIDTDGNVGIGTTSPGVKLEVVGAIRGGSFPNSTTNSGEAWFGRAADRTLGTMTIQLGGSSATNTFFEIVDRAWSKVMYGLSGEAPSNSIRVTSSGNVGLGTGSPEFQLHVARSSGDSVIVADSGAYSNSQFRFQEAGSLAAAITFVSSDDSLRFYNGGDRFTILSSGNVGIGTASPTALLHLSSGTPYIYLDDTSTSGTRNRFQILNGDVGTTQTVTFGFNNTSGTNLQEVIAFNESGNVGIGTASPSERLEVNGSIRLSDGNADGPQLKLASSGYSDWNIDNYSGSLRAYYGSTEYTRLTSSGYFGIGTSSPSYKLHVEGNVSGISIYASHDIAAFSDITVKKEVKRIENAVDKVKELNGYTYVRTDDETGTRRAGVIAQEVQKVLPEVVSANPDGTLNVAYANMVALLIEAVKEQQKEIDELKRMLNK